MCRTAFFRTLLMLFMVLVVHVGIRGEQTLITPTITVREVAVPYFKSLVGRSDTASIPAISAVHLTTDLNLVLSGNDATKFVVTPDTLTHADGTVAETIINVIYSPNLAGEDTATLTISSAGATSLVYELVGMSYDTNGAGTVDQPFTVADVKALNNSFSSTTRYWTHGYIVGVPYEGNVQGDLSIVDLDAPFDSNSAIAISDDQNEKDLTKMIGIELFSTDIRSALNLVDNPTNLNKRVKVFGVLDNYFSEAEGVKMIRDYVLDPNINSSIEKKPSEIYTVDGKLHVLSVGIEQITVFDVLGKQLYDNLLIVGHNVITIPVSGVLVIKIGNKVSKVIL